MAGAYPRVLADGTVPSLRGVLYRCPARTRAELSIVTLVNAHEDDVILNVYLNTSGTPRMIVPKNLVMRARTSLELDQAYVLEPDGTLEADANRPYAIEFTVSGIEHR